MGDFGWELAKKAFAQDLKSKNDVVVAFVHWKLLTQGLRCVGKGENFTLSSDETLSELLPEGWASGDDYALRYRRQEKESDKFLLKVIKVDDSLIVNLIRISDEVVSSWNVVNIDDLVDWAAKDIKDLKSLSATVQNELLSQFFKSDKAPKASTSSEKKTEKPGPSNPPPRDPDFDPLRIGGPRRPLGGGIPLGGSDLDPLGRMGGGGMTIDPRGGSGFGPGGPQFDPAFPGQPNPFGGPPRRGGPGRGGHRNYGDEMPPPDFHDDMFG